MAWQENLSEDVREVTLYRPRPVYLHGYVLPFLFLYLSVLLGWSQLYGLSESWEALLITLAALAILNVLVVLFCVWSVHFRAFLTCTKVTSLDNAKVVKVVPTPNNGSSELVPLIRNKHKVTKEPLIWFMFQKTKYTLTSDGTFQPLQFPIGMEFSEYQSWQGYREESEVAAVRMTYGKNRLDVTLPDFWELFRERATAPFFVFQVFCVGLWCLDEYWYYSIFTLFMLVTFEAILVKQQQRNMSEIRKMGSRPYTVQALRGGRWTKISSEELLPGDIISIGRSKDGVGVMSCDILLLRGSCIVDEAMLTGESVPQMKEPLDESSPYQTLDLQRDSRLHVISGGTKIVQHSPPDRAGLRPNDGGCVGYVLRTGFNTSQGKLLRTILYGVKRVTANNLETFVFILFLLVFAISAAAYVWIKGTEDPERNRYKLFLECTLILTSVVPPELPIELSLAVNTSLIALSKLGIYCTEPFRIPYGGKVDVCCFDKTGTLTSNDLVIKGIAGIESSSSTSKDDGGGGGGGDKPSLVPAKDAPFNTQCILATCHSLVLLDGDLVGDPLEKVALHAVDWNLSKGDAVTSKRGRKVTLKIIQRFHFSSALKRMSVISSLIPPQSSGHTHLVSVKGAPEVLKEMFSRVPVDYDGLYSKLTRHGARVLALGFKFLDSTSSRELNNLERNQVERDLTFAGFLAISCPLKRESKSSISCLLESSHHVMMLTGDNPLTACHVAKELKIATRKTLVLTETNEGAWHWQSIGGSTAVPMTTPISELGKTYDLCLTGNAMEYILNLNDGGTLFDKILPYITVFARVSPKQKETVVTSYRRQGYNTLMCGDGTNDVGALKHAHVGVALLSTVPLQKTTPTSNEGNSASTPPSDNRLTRRPLHPQSSKSSRSGGGVVSGQTPPLTGKQARDKRLREMLKQMDEMEPQLVRLGDASIASPFTSRHSSISCICHVIKQGRCTLVTTLQMFKILALNALILAYSQSVLFLDGIKFSDTQATMQGILLAGCFLFISRSKPLTTLSEVRPLPNIFNIYTVLTVLGQFFVHFSCLVYLVREAKTELPESDEEFVDLEKEFEQNELNSSVYLISIAMQISNFAVNYKGHPFMASLLENKPLLYSLLVTTSVLFLLATGLMPELGVFLEISPFTAEFRQKLLVVLVADFLVSYLIDRILSFFLGRGQLKTPSGHHPPASSEI